MALAVSQEEERLDAADWQPFQAGVARPDPLPSFEVLVDVERRATKAWGRTTAYLLDPSGVVRQVFPMTLRARPSWIAILAEIERQAQRD